MMLKTSLFYFLFLLVFSSFAQFIDSTNTNYKAYYFDNGLISSEGFLIEGKPDKYWITYYSNGLRQSEGNRLDFKLDGVWKFYRKNGNIKQEIFYSEDKKNGKQISYDNNCLIVLEENFLNNLKDGNSIYYFSDSSNSKIKKIIPFIKDKENGIGYEYANDGSLITIYSYKNGFLSSKEAINRRDNQGNKKGIWKIYYKNLRLKREERFKNDLLNGYSKYYNKEGKLDSAVLYINGKKQRNEENEADFNLSYNYYKDGNVKSISAYNLEGKKDGVSTNYDEKGNVVSTEFYKNGIIIISGLVDKKGKKQGEWISYYLTGEIKSKGSYQNNYQKGKWIYYYRNGKIEQEGFFDSAGRFSGEWKWYYENGNLLRSEEFRKGIEDGVLEELDILGNIITKGDYIDGEKEGEWFYELNDHKEIGKYRYGKRNGFWRFNYPNNKPSFEGSYIDGQPEGKHKYYYLNGIIEREENYSYGLKDGKWKWYDSFGQETLSIYYKEGIEKRIDGQKIKNNKK